MSKISDFDVLSLLNVRNVKLGLMVNRGKQQSFSTELSVVLNKDGHHGLLYFLSFLPCSVLRNLESEANQFYNRANKSYNAAL